jgi:leucyl aminopeptidase
MQKNLFGAKTEVTKKEPVKEKSKSSFPDLSIAKGLHKQEAMSESVFWHRILINKSIRQQKPEQFLKILSNEIAFKKGMKDPYLAILDSLKRGS